MPLQVNLNADATSTAPDGSAANPLNIAGGAVAQGSTTAGQSGTLVQAAVLASPPAYTTAQTSPITQTVFGALRVSGPNLTNNTGSVYPIQIGALGVSALPNAATTGRTDNVVATLAGVLVALPYCIPEQSWSFAVATGGIVNTTTAVTLVAAQAAGIRNYCTKLQIATDLLTTASEIAIRDGAAGTVIWRGKLAAQILPQTMVHFDPPLRGTAATLMEFVTLTATGAALGVFVSAQGYFAP